MAEPRLSPTRRDVLARIVEQRFGLSLDAYGPVLVDLTLEALPDVIDEHDPAVERRLLSAFSIPETCFFRHPEQLAAFATWARERKAETLHVWSAGCATGEEAYSLSATLFAAGVPGHRVLGTDLDPSSIERARAATYRAWSLRGVLPALAATVLCDEGVERRVRPEVCERVTFEVCNLVRGPYPSRADAIFCRNVLMYFQPGAARGVFAELARTLAPGGLLVLGYADPAPPPDAFRLETLGSVRVYRRGSAKASESRPRRVSERPPRSPLPSPVPPTLPDPFASVRALAGRRELDAALALLRELVARGFGLSVEAHVLTAMIAEEAGQPRLALDAARRACFLAPGAPVPIYLFGEALYSLGDTKLGRERLRQALSLLDTEPSRADGSLPHGEGLTAPQLRRMIRARLG